MLEYTQNKKLERHVTDTPLAAPYVPSTKALGLPPKVHLHNTYNNIYIAPYVQRDKALPPPPRQEDPQFGLSAYSRAEGPRQECRAKGHGPQRVKGKKVRTRKKKEGPRKECRAKGHGPQR